MLPRKIALLISGLLIIYAGLSAGDTASFVDLGFSSDGRIFMFGQYGVQSQALRPWAELFIVDVANNNFVSDGRISYTHDNPILAGQDGSGALYGLIADSSGIARRYGISYPNQGQPLYISLDTNPPSSGERIEFRDFLTRRYYKANLVSSTEGSGKDVKSSFCIYLECSTGDGRVKNYTVGDLKIKRSLVSSYNIKRVITNSNGDSIIFVIEMKLAGDGGHNTRYMVEALRL